MPTPTFRAAGCLSWRNPSVSQATPRRLQLPAQATRSSQGLWLGDPRAETEGTGGACRRQYRPVQRVSTRGQARGSVMFEAGTLASLAAPAQAAARPVRASSPPDSATLPCHRIPTLHGTENGIVCMAGMGNESYEPTACVGPTALGPRPRTSVPLPLTSTCTSKIDSTLPHVR